MYDAIVLAGGAARRLGGTGKPALRVGASTLLARVVAAVADAGRIVVVGPRADAGREVSWCRESPPGGGPVAALATGVGETSAERLVVLAADLPFVAPAVPVLLEQLTTSHAAFLADADGRVNYLAGAWRRAALTTALGTLGDPGGAAMRSVVPAAGGGVAVPDPDGWGRDCDTWADVAAAREAVRVAVP